MASKTVLVAVEVPGNVSTEQVRTLVERAALHRWGLYADVEGRPRVGCWETERDGMDSSEALAATFNELSQYLMGLQEALTVRETQRRLTVVPDGDEERDKG